MKTYFRIILSITILFAFSSVSKTQDLKKRFDIMLEEQFPTNEPGAVAIVAKNGEIIYHKAVGKADLELNASMNTEMVFKIGSITKQFTAVSILMLMEQGKLKLNDPVTKFIPDYPTHGHTITIHNLLTHSSGIANSTTINPWDSQVRKKDFKPKELIDYFKNEPIKSVPGALYRYNNFGYHILGYIIEIASGFRYEDFVENNIFKALGMQNSYYGSHTEIIKNRAIGYTRSDDGFDHAEYISMTQPYSAGSLMSTTRDQVIWINALLSNKLIKKESLHLAWTNYELNNGSKINYGYGWFINDINGSSTYEHAGGIAGFQTNAIYLPAEDVFVAVFTNCDRTDPRPVSTRMAALAIGKSYPEPESIVKLSDEQLKRWVGEYEYPDGSTRIVELKDNWLYWSRPGRFKFRLLPSESNRFLLENTFTQVEFESSQGAVVAHITARIVRREAKKIR